MPVNKLVAKSYSIFMIGVGVASFFFEPVVIAQNIPVIDSYFPIPVGLEAKFEHEDKTTVFILADDKSDTQLIFNKENAILRVREQNVVELTQPLTVITKEEGEGTRNQILTYFFDQENNSLALTNFIIRDEFGISERNPEVVIPILTTLTDCPNDSIGRKINYTLILISDDGANREVNDLKWFSRIFTNPIGSIEIGSTSFFDVCSLKVQEPISEPDDAPGSEEPPTVISIGWNLAKGYGIIQIEQEFDNGSQISNLVVTNITDFWTSSITVDIVPSQAVDAGARWRVIETATGSESDLKGSGELLENLNQGKHTIVFTDVEGWSPPSDQVVTLGTELVSATGSYTREIGSVLVTIEPVEAINAGARWRISNAEFDSQFQSSGDPLVSVPTGEYTLQFQNIAGWFTPSNQTISVKDGVEIRRTATYTHITGNITVMITPAAAVNAGAQWKIKRAQSSFESEFMNSGIALPHHVPVGQYILVPRDISGWVALSQVVTVERDMALQVVLNYGEDTDDDEMDDMWEEENLGSKNALPHVDFDGDGYSNVQEFRNGTRPGDYVVPITHGWNLISLARIPDISTVERIFTRVDFQPVAWTYDGNQLEKASALSDPLSAYWVYQKGNSNTGFVDPDIQGSSAPLFEIRLNPGWNLVSIDRVPDDDSVTEIFKNIKVSLPIWKWRQNRFVTAEKMNALSGYWIYLSGEEKETVQLDITVQ